MAEENAIIERWLSYVDVRLNAVLNAAVELLSPLLESLIDYYQYQLSNYINGYRTILIQELEEKKKGQKNIEERLVEVDLLMRTTASLTTEILQVMNFPVSSGNSLGVESTNNTNSLVKEEEPQNNDLMAAIKAFTREKLRRTEESKRLAETSGFEQEMKTVLNRLRNDIEPDDSSESWDETS